MLNNIGLPGLLLLVFVVLPVAWLILRALWRVGCRK